VVIPEREHSTKNAINRYHESQPQWRRRYIGASSIGEPCARRLWYQFRWAKVEQFPGRVLRLFRRGHREEETVVQDLKAIGCVVSHTGDDQLEIKVSPHIVVHPDGVVESGLPEAPNKRHTLEIKTHSAKSFAKLQKEGIPDKHTAQMQVAMHGTGVDRALYVAVNKDTDELFIERVRYDKDTAEKIIARGTMIAESPEAPLGVSTDPTWYQCRFCPFHSVCYKNEAADKNCKTCAHSTPRDDGWYCERWKDYIPERILETGCDSYVPHPDMHPGEIVEAGETWAVYQLENGERVRYGDPA